MSAVTSKSNSPAIIRIVPSNFKKVSIPGKGVGKVKTYIVRSTENTHSETRPLPSTKVQSAGHKVTIKAETSHINNDEDEIYIEDSDSAYVESENQIQTVRIQRPRPKPIILKRHMDNLISTISQKLNKVHSEHCCCSCKETLNTILQKQQEIINYLKNGVSFKRREEKLDLLPTMPFNDMDDFLDFDGSLVNENVRDQLHIKLAKLLVSTEQKSVSNIMSSIMTNELCRLISWIGIKDTLAFGNTNIVGMIVDMVQEHHCVGIDVVKARIAEWLRRCGDRINNDLKRNKKRAEQGFINDRIYFKNESSN